MIRIRIAAIAALSAAITAATTAYAAAGRYVNGRYL